MSEDSVKSESSSGEGAGQETANGSGAEKLFSQDEVNRIIKGRSERELQKVLGEIGFESVDELKTLVKQKREREEAEKGELLKAQERAVELEKKLVNAEEAHKVVVVQAEVTAKAAKLGIVDPDAAYRLLDKGALEFGEDGRPTNAEALLVAMLKERPYLAGSGSSAMNPGKVRVDEEDRIIAEARKWAGLK